MNAKIISITVNSSVNLCYNERPVATPHWESDVDMRDCHGSQRPAAFLISEPNNNYLEVELSLQDPDHSGPFILEGSLEDSTFRSSSFNHQDASSDTIKVRVFPNQFPSHFKQVQGDVKWRLTKDSAIVCPLEETRMEIYWLYDFPGKMYKKGAWVEVLQLLAKQCYRGLTSKEDIITRVVNYCHSGAGLRYDIADSISHYTQAYWGGGFNLNAFLKKAYPLCICTDLAGLVQVLLGAIGLAVDYCYTHPFGFLNNTNLIGRGQVNNTYFLGKEPAPEVLNRFSPKRWGFGSHAFCTWGTTDKENVLDACAGPHIGHESAQEYLDAVIDRHQKLYPDRRESLTRPAEVNDIYKCTGITDVHGITCDAGLCGELEEEDERVKRFKSQTGFNNLSSELSSCPVKYVVYDWDDPRLCPAIGDSWTINYQHIQGGCRSAIKEWSLVRGLELLKISVFVSTGNEEVTKKQVMNTIASSPLADIPFKKKTVNPLGHFHVSAHEKELWIYYNVCFLVESHHSPINLDPICKWLQQKAEANLQDTLTGRPRFAETATSPPYIIMYNGQTKTLKIHPKNANPHEPFLVNYFIKDQIIQISGETTPTPAHPSQDYSLTFKALRTGLTDINIFLINRKNLLCSTGVRVYCEVDEKKSPNRH